MIRYDKKSLGKLAFQMISHHIYQVVFDNLTIALCFCDNTKQALTRELPCEWQTKALHA